MGRSGLGGSNVNTPGVLARKDVFELSIPSHKALIEVFSRLVLVAGIVQLPGGMAHHGPLSVDFLCRCAPPPSRSETISSTAGADAH